MSAKELLRDAALEYMAREIATPIAIAANLPPQRLNIYIVHSPELNALALDSETIVLFSGLIDKITETEQLQALLAHEIAHIRNGHHAKRLNNFFESKKRHDLGLLLGALSLATGASPAAAIGVTIGAGIAAEENFLAHTRAEEASADHAAMRYLTRADIHPQALYGLLKILHDKARLTLSEHHYVSTHPPTSERLRAVDAYILAYENLPAFPSATEAVKGTPDYWFARLKTKLSALTGQNKTSPHPKGSELDLLFRAVHALRFARLSDANRLAQRLVMAHPNDGFYQALLGEILFEKRRYDGAVGAYKKALLIRPDEVLFEHALAKAYLGQESEPATRKALVLLEKARAKHISRAILRSLGLAYARLDNHAMAILTAAELYALSGEFETMKFHAKKALDVLPYGTPGWVRAQDLLEIAQQAGILGEDKK